MVGYWDRNLRNVIANAAYLDFFGISPEDLRGRHIRELLGDELFAKNEPYMRAALAGEPQVFDRELLDQSGGRRYTQASYTPDVVDGEVRGFAVLVTDITARRVAEIAAKVAEDRFRALFVTAPIGTVLLDLEGTITDANDAAARLLDRPRGQLIGMSLFDVSPEAEHPLIREALASVIRDERLSGLERRYLRPDGSEVWAQVDATIVHDPVAGERQILGQIQDVSERRSHQAELEALARHDSLTGLLNRRGLVELLDARPRGSVVTVDLDHFKIVNDIRGHQSGDEVLRAVADVLRARTRAEDDVARFGGDEFVIVLSHAALADARRWAVDMARRIADARLGVPGRTVTASVGVAVIEPGLTTDELLARADREMYADKRRRR